MDNIKDLRNSECKHENTELLEIDVIDEYCVVKCKDCGRVLKFMGIVATKYECVPDEIPCLDIKVDYTDEDPECFDRGCVDLKMVHKSIKDE